MCICLCTRSGIDTLSPGLIIFLKTPIKKLKTEKNILAYNKDTVLIFFLSTFTYPNKLLKVKRNSKLRYSIVLENHSVLISANI